MVAAWSADVEEEEGVLVLNEDNFDEVVNNAGSLEHVETADWHFRDHSGGILCSLVWTLQETGP